MRTLIHGSSNGHYTTTQVKVKEDVIQEPFTIEHVEHEPIEVGYQFTKKRIVVEQNPYENKLREIAD
jgi:hypothetical protein